LAILSTGIIFVFFRKIVAFLNLNLNLPIGIFIVFLILAFWGGHKISKPKKGKSKIYFKDYGRFSWLVETYQDGYISVADNPHCLECHTEYQNLSKNMYDEITLVCPNPKCKNHEKDNTGRKSALEVLHDAVEKVVKAEAKQYAKK
ncbi:MAG: hypothetical protein ABIA97_03895, partial [Candidatus Omnitrophota bacterium]